MPAASFTKFTQPEKFIINKIKSKTTTAGLEIGDEILEVDGYKISDPGLGRKLLEAKPGEPCIVTIMRNGKTLEITPLPAFLWVAPTYSGQAVLKRILGREGG